MAYEERPDAPENKSRHPSEAVRDDTQASGVTAVNLATEATRLLALYCIPTASEDSELADRASDPADVQKRT